MKPVYYLMIVIGLGVIIGLAFESWRQKRKVRRYIRERYGKAPSKGYQDKLESIRNYWQVCAEHFEGYTEVDDLTWNDLELDLFFEAINSTWSSLGSEALYARLHRLDGTDLEPMIQAFMQDEHLRTEVSYYLYGLGKHDFHRAWQFVADAEKYKPLGYYPIQSFLPLIGLAVIALDAPVGMLIATLGIAWNLYTRNKRKYVVEQGLDAVRYISNAVSFSQKIIPLLQPTLAKDAERLDQAIDPIKRLPARMPMQLQPDPTNPMYALADYFNQILLLDFIHYNRAINLMLKSPDSVHQLWQALGDVEIALAMASLEQRVPSVVPEFIAEHRITAQAIVHPLLEDPVPNPVDFAQGILVSGSNASGKSTYVKAIALSAITAQNLGRAFAKEFQMKPGQIITSMAIRDNIYAGDSYFVAEIKSLKRMIEATQSGRVLYLTIDEILKGTNTVERIAASNALLNWFHEAGVPVISATHDIELTELQAHQMVNVHFREEISDHEIHFDYQLKPGPTQTTNAINLLRYYAFPPEVTEKAQAAADDFKLTRQWTSTD